jgi:hypothetical protein
MTAPILKHAAIRPAAISTEPLRTQLTPSDPGRRHRPSVGAAFSSSQACISESCLPNPPLGTPSLIRQGNRGSASPIISREFAATVPSLCLESGTFAASCQAAFAASAAPAFGRCGRIVSSQRGRELGHAIDHSQLRKSLAVQGVIYSPVPDDSPDDTFLNCAQRKK